MEKLTKAPLNLASITIQFPHQLKVSETRSAYHELVKKDFPLVVFPENRELKFDFSDCFFRNNEGNAQIRVATNYFVLETIAYVSKEVFWDSFSKVFFSFVKLFDIQDVTALKLSYDNLIMIDNNLVGGEFTDYFSLAAAFRNKEEKKFVTVDGSFLFAVKDGLVQIEVKPKQNPQTNIWDTFNFKVDCQINKKLSMEKPDDLNKAFNSAHQHIEDMFISSLTEKYLASIK
jgi:uncharacterized protein (TIGR04255 family)